MSDLRAAFYEGNRSIRVGDCVPVAPSPSEVQIRVAYCGICGTDLHIFHGAMDHRVHFPQVLGHEMSGVITTVGSEVEGFVAGEHGGGIRAGGKGCLSGFHYEAIRLPNVHTLAMGGLERMIPTGTQ